MTATEEKEKNNLYPVFLCLDKLSILIVGGGNVGLEKISSVLNSAPDSRVKLVAPQVHPDIKAISGHPFFSIEEKEFRESDLSGIQLIIIATENKELNAYIKTLAAEKGILANVADTPALCDFYLGSIVQKGALKIAISTNGKSPTIAKRLKEWLQESIPPEIDSLLTNMQTLRNGLKDDFAGKVKKLNEITEVLAVKQLDNPAMAIAAAQKRWQRIVLICLFGFICILLGYALAPYISWRHLHEGFSGAVAAVDQKTFLLMLLCGFLAQMTDGSLGMGYGTIATTFLLSMGVNPAIVSSRVHTARVFSSGVSGYSHHRFGNINKKLFRALVVPGVLGAIVGATLAYLGKEYATYVKLPLSVYTLYLGIYILRKAIGKKQEGEKVKRAGWLASAGGFMDAFAGGGWGTLVTSTLISKRKSPRYVIGSVCLAEFFVVMSSAVTFFILLKHIPLADVAGLILGGVAAAPIAARLAGRVPVKKMLIVVAVFVMAASINTLYKAVKSVANPVVEVKTSR